MEVREACLLSMPSRFALGVVALHDEAGRGVAATFNVDADCETTPVLLLCGKCARGNRGSGVFFVLLSRKMEDVGVFFGVVLGLDNKALSVELASDLEDSEGR